jgi:hypothetical protein
VKARIAALLVTLAAACAADAGDAPKSAAGVGSGSVSSSGAGTGTSGQLGSDDSSAAPASSANDDEAGTPPDASLSSDVDVQEATVVASEDGPSEVSATDQLGPAESCATCPIELKYTTTTTTAATQDIRPHYEIDNNGTSPQSLTDLTVRYYFTADGSAQQSYVCDYAAIDCGSIQATFATITPAKTNADHYLELSFTAGSIPAGGSSGEIQVRFHDSNYQVTFNQSNDYSFDASTTQYADWKNVTVYRGGALVWGTEPQ